MPAELRKVDADVTCWLLWCKYLILHNLLANQSGSCCFHMTPNCCLSTSIQVYECPLPVDAYMTLITASRYIRVYAIANNEPGLKKQSAGRPVQFMLGASRSDRPEPRDRGAPGCQIIGRGTDER